MPYMHGVVCVHDISDMHMLVCMTYPHDIGSGVHGGTYAMQHTNICHVVMCCMAYACLHGTTYAMQHIATWRMFRLHDTPYAMQHIATWRIRMTCVARHWPHGIRLCCMA